MICIYISLALVMTAFSAHLCDAMEANTLSNLNNTSNTWQQIIQTWKSTHYDRLSQDGQEIVQTLLDAHLYSQVVLAAYFKIDNPSASKFGSDDGERIYKDAILYLRNMTGSNEPEVTSFFIIKNLFLTEYDKFPEPLHAVALSTKILDSILLTGWESPVLKQAFPNRPPILLSKNNHLYSTPDGWINQILEWKKTYYDSYEHQKDIRFMLCDLFYPQLAILDEQESREVLTESKKRTEISTLIEHRTARKNKYNTIILAAIEPILQHLEQHNDLKTAAAMAKALAASITKPNKSPSRTLTKLYQYPSFLPQ